MKYRRFDRLDWEVSVLGFGVMQLPQIGEDPAHIHETESIKMIRYAIDHGVNYLDSGYPYSARQHERLLGLINKALQDGYRQKVKVAVTLPPCPINTTLELDRYLNKQLRCLNIDRIDVYLLGGLNRDTWATLQELDVLRWAEGAMRDGRIDKLGFSCHDHFQIFKNILDAFDSWTVCQLQYSYMDVDHDPGVSGITYAAEKGLAVVVTEPLRRGRLTKEPPESVAEIWARAPRQYTLTEWGLRWVWNHPEISVVVCDMSTEEQVKKNIVVADSAEPDSLTVHEEVLISRVREAYRTLIPIPCSSCRACMPCPIGIDVPRIFELYNDAIIYSDIETARSIYRLEQHAIDICTECAACAKACAKKIAVLDWLKTANQLLAGIE
ncbi:MAG: aldo/keto reductase [Promethearchaeota archaeon]